jgi:uncharacterized protein YcbX
MRITRVSTTPIKGLRLHHPREIELGTPGAAGDRRFFLVDEASKPLSITKAGVLTHFTADYQPDTGRLVLESARGGRWEGEVVIGDPIAADFYYANRLVQCHVVEGPWGGVLAEAVGRKVRLVRTSVDDPGFDLHPVTLLGSASVRALAEHAGLPEVDSRRFRMLLEFESSQAHVEDGWKGGRLRVGGAELLVGGGVPRCAAVTRHPATGARDVPIVQILKRYRGLTEGELGPGVRFGVYADVVRGGTVRVGDELRLD